MAERNRRELRVYRTYTKKHRQTDCGFCEISRDSPQCLAETTHFFIIRNIFPYSYWDIQRVSDHLMIIPKKHTDTLNDFDANEALEFVRLVSDYEHNGYNFYGRTPNNKSKSIVHQHTHLIKTSNRVVKFLLYVRKPHLRFTR